MGGANGVGATGYVLAMMELMEQLRATERRVDHIPSASGSGGVLAGRKTVARVAGFEGPVSGLSLDQADPERRTYEEEITTLANKCAQYIGSGVRLTKQHIKVIYGYTGEGYGVVGNLEREAIRLMARSEGIILDPVYTGRAFGALVDLIR